MSCSYNYVIVAARVEILFFWDIRKSRINLAKHGVSFETAQFVFSDPLQLSRQDRDENGEIRWQTLGLVCEMLLLVAHTWVDENDGGEKIRIISARRATKFERKEYEQGS